MRRVKISCSEEELVPVSELRQYHFCPRVVYYHTIGVEEAPKDYMLAGKERQEDLWFKERRRRTLAGLRKLRVDERRYGISLSSMRLCLMGTLDLAVRIGDEWLVVEVKSGPKPRDRNIPISHKVQAAAYSMLLEEAMNSVARRFFLLYEGGLVEIQMTDELRDHVIWTTKKILRIYRGWIPPMRRLRKCSSCGYSTYCMVQW